MNENPTGSCLICGHLRSYAVWHATTPDAGVCLECREAATLYPETKRDLENAQQWLDSEPEWKAEFMERYRKACEARAEAQTNNTLLSVEVHNLQTSADLWKDEFKRIIAICRSYVSASEIVGICERAMSNITAHVTLIEQRDKLEAERDTLKREAEELRGKLRRAEATIDELNQNWIDENI
jgi:hypothetical protein